MAQYCPPQNPCNCIAMPMPSATPTPKPACPSGCCLHVCDTIIAPNDAVGPCGQMGVLDLSTLESEQSCCTAAPVFKLVEYDNAHFVSVVIENGQLKWITQRANRLHQFGTIRIKTTCVTESGQLLSYTFCVTIGIKNHCLGNACEQCDTCDPCTGECVESDVKLALTQPSTPTDITITNAG